MSTGNHNRPKVGIIPGQWLQVEEMYQANLRRIKRRRRNLPPPRCYISHLPDQSDWARKLARYLHQAGVFLVDKVELVGRDDFIIILDTPRYQDAFQNMAPSLERDGELIRERLGRNSWGILALVLEGNSDRHEFCNCRPGNFCDETHFLVGLFDLVLSLYSISLTHVKFAPLRQSLHEQWERTLARREVTEVKSALKVFISYSHQDEEFKDDLITMLEGLKRQGVIDLWQDRRIEEGDDWYQKIRDAMNECDLAILLVSQHFIASRFIQDEELPRLLQHCRKKGLRVVPIVVRPCKWTSEPGLKGIQALPRNGTPVITYSKENGDRDQVWTDIATAIEKRAREKSS